MVINTHFDDSLYHDILEPHSTCSKNTHWLSGDRSQHLGKKGVVWAGAAPFCWTMNLFHFCLSRKFVQEIFPVLLLIQWWSTGRVYQHHSPLSQDSSSWTSWIIQDFFKIQHHSRLTYFICLMFPPFFMFFEVSTPPREVRYGWSSVMPWIWPRTSRNGMLWVWL